MAGFIKANPPTFIVSKLSPIMCSFILLNMRKLGNKRVTSIRRGDLWFWLTPMGFKLGLRRRIKMDICPCNGFR